MHMTHNISITFTPIGKEVDDANKISATTSLTEERVIELIKEHTQSQSDAIEQAVKDAIDDFDFSDIVDDCINNHDFSYDIEQGLDGLSGSQLYQLARSLRRDQEMLSKDDIDVDDIMLKSEHLNEDDVMTRGDMSDAIADDLKRDWFKMLVSDMVKEALKHAVIHGLGEVKPVSTPAPSFDNETPNIQ